MRAGKTRAGRETPGVLLVQPPVYDFALYDLHFKPFGLMRLGKWFEDGEYRVRLVNGLDYKDPETVRLLGPARRNADGTGKFHRRPLSLSDTLPIRAAGGGGADESFDRFRRSFGERTKRYINRYGMHPESFRSRIGEERPDIVLVTSQMTYWYPGVKEAVDTVRELFPDVPVAVGGVYASLLPEHCEGVTGADAVAVGGDVSPLKAILEEHGLPVPTGEVPNIPLMLPGIWEDGGVLRLNRGCPYSCPYCASGRIEPNFRRGDAEEVWSTALEMNGRYGTSTFAFYDDALLMEKEEAFLPFLEKAASSRKEFSFYLPNAVHIRYIDSETARLMVRAGFREVRLGYETADEGSAASTAKYLPVDVPKVVEILRGAGFARGRIILYVLGGLPGQTADEVEETIKKASRLAVHLSLAEFSPVPRTSLWNLSASLSRYPIEKEPMFQNNTIFPLEWDRFTREDMERLKGDVREHNRRIGKGSTRIGPNLG
ncbi:MAG: radical SAM protein [Spirochaetia bacterium]